MVIWYSVVLVYVKRTIDNKYKDLVMLDLLIIIFLNAWLSNVYLIWKCVLYLFEPRFLFYQSFFCFHQPLLVLSSRDEPVSASGKVVTSLMLLNTKMDFKRLFLATLDNLNWSSSLHLQLDSIKSDLHAIYIGHYCFDCIFGII